MSFPGFAEADVREADGAPSQNRGKTGDGLHPGKCTVFGTGSREECEEAKGGGDDDGEEGAALAVDVGEEAGGLALVGEGGEGARGAVDGGVADGEDGDHDDDVHDGVEACDSGVVDGDDKGGGFGVRRELADEAGVGVGNQKADEGEGDDVEEADTPEDLLDRCGEGLAGVGGFGCGKTDEFGAGKGKGGGHKDRAEAFEAVVEGAGVLPVAASNKWSVGSSTDVEDYAENAGYLVPFFRP